MTSTRPSWRQASSATFPMDAASPAVAVLRKSGPLLRRHMMVALLASLFGLSLLMHRADLHIDPWRGDNVPFYAAGLVAIALRFALPRTDWRHVCRWRGSANTQRYSRWFR